MQKTEDDLLAQEGARTWRDEAAEEFLAQCYAKAMCIPGQKFSKQKLASPARFL